MPRRKRSAGAITDKVPLFVVLTFVVWLVSELFKQNMIVQVPVVLWLGWELKRRTIQKGEEKDVVLYLIGLSVVGAYFTYMTVFPVVGGLLYSIGSAFVKLVSSMLWWVCLSGIMSRLKD